MLLLPRILSLRNQNSMLGLRRWSLNYFIRKGCLVRKVNSLHHSRLLPANRCLVFANGFYEIKNKQAHYFTYADGVNPTPIKKQKKLEKLPGSYDARVPTHRLWKPISQLPKHWLRTHAAHEEHPTPVAPLCFAGLYDICMSQDNTEPPLISCTLLTIPSKGTPMEKICDR
eukprot:Blabericola_migrator_1__5068@NODE_2623_length_2523_cov_85_302524_g1644_i0_p2_GENE_NODE_2623_length_2523_cov_85_302524_g1644_i0NODE_2623_length_2523_cov_85_302524_g1644_i0_p2_ORF_typecomplete_len171_score20_38SRAP/PF02586_14/6_6e12_NODE_2623_length_2523_cov_85_302524_g1644_i0450962